MSTYDIRNAAGELVAIGRKGSKPGTATDHPAPASTGRKELKPCPFCGNETVHVQDSYHNGNGFTPFPLVSQLASEEEIRGVHSRQDHHEDHQGSCPPSPSICPCLHSR